MTTLTVTELRQHIQTLEQHIADTLNDFSEVTGVSVDDIVLAPVSRYGASFTTYYVKLNITI